MNLENKCIHKYNLLLMQFYIYFFVCVALIQPICLPQLPNIKNMDMANSLSFIAGEWRGPTQFLGIYYEINIIHIHKNYNDCVLFRSLYFIDLI